MQHEKQHGLIRFLAHGMLSHSQQETMAQLGDRSKYIGMSDIGKAMECFRAAVADKSGHMETVLPTDILAMNQEEIKKTLLKQITLQRGHWQEYGLEKAVKATGVHCIPQLEICIHHKGVPVKAHLDFTIVRESPVPAVRILELKSNEHIPDHLYASYEAQVYGQLGLLYEFWNQSCFSVPSSSGKNEIENVTFPEVAQCLFGIQMPDDPASVDIQAWALSISMSDVKPFGPYVYEGSMLKVCLDKAEQIWWKKERHLSGEVALDDLDYAKGFHPLCDFCGLNDGCPKFANQTLRVDQDYDADLDELANLKEQESAIKKKKKVLEQRIKNAYQTAGASGWLSGSEFRFKVSIIPGRKSLDKEALHTTLSTQVRGVSVDALLNGCEKASSSHERLYVSKINRAVAKAA